MGSCDDDITPGSAWRLVKLGSEAVYEVISAHGGIIEVVVRSAPGLAPGTHVRLTRESFEEMEPVADSVRPKNPARGQRTRRSA